MASVYMLFSGDSYYPSGGALDYEGTFNSPKAASKFWKQRYQDSAGNVEYEWGKWAQIVRYDPENGDMTILYDFNSGASANGRWSKHVKYDFSRR